MSYADSRRLEFRIKELETKIRIFEKVLRGSGIDFDRAAERAFGEVMKEDVERMAAKLKIKDICYACGQLR